MVRCNKQDSRGNSEECKTFLLRCSKLAFVTSGREPDAARWPIDSIALTLGHITSAPSLRRHCTGKGN